MKKILISALIIALSGVGYASPFATRANAQFATNTICVPVVVTGSLRLGSNGEQVRNLQKILNAFSDTQVAASGAGSVGNETTYFGPATYRAVIKFQQKYSSEVLTPVGLKVGTGFVGTLTLQKLNALNVGCAVQNPTTPNYPIPTPTPTPNPNPSNPNSSLSISSIGITTVAGTKFVTVYGTGFANIAPGNTVIFNDIMQAAGNVVSNDGRTITFELRDGFGAFCDCPPNSACACPMIYYMRTDKVYKVKIKNLVTHEFSNEITASIE